MDCFSDLNFASNGRGVRDSHECVQCLTYSKFILQ